MLIDESNENRKTKQKQGLISKKITMKGQHTFFAHFFVVALHDYNVKLSVVTRFMEEMSYVRIKNLLLVFLFSFFFTASNFHHTGR